MKQLILLSFLFTGLFAFSQTQPYVEFTMPNSAAVNIQDLEYEKGDSMIVLVQHNAGLVEHVYVLENMTTPTFVQPTLPAGWNIQILYKQHKTVYHFNIGDQYRVVNDNNGYSYLELH